MGTFYYFGHVKGRQPSLGVEFYTKVLPTMFFGAVVWFFSTLYFSGLLWAPALDLTQLSVQTILIAIISFGITWIVLFIAALFQKNTVAMIFFFIGAGFNGIIQSFVVAYVAQDLGENLTRLLFTTASLLAVGATGAAMVLGLMLKDKIAKHYCLYFMVFGLVFSLIESAMTLIFGYSNFLLDLIFMAYVFGVIVFDAATLPGKIKRGYWMMAVIDIFFDLVLMIMRIFIILASLFSRD